MRIEKIDGEMHIEGLQPKRAMQVREALEYSLDAIVTLKIGTANDTTIVVCGTRGEGLGEDETPQLYRMFINGFLYARTSRKETDSCGCTFRIRTVRTLDKHCGGHAKPPEEEL